MQKKHKKLYIEIIMLLIFLITFVTMIVCNIQLQNKKDSFIKKSYSIPVGIFPGNKAAIDDKGNIYVATGMLGVVQKFNKNGDFIKSILIKDDIDMIKNERDGIHVYAGKFDYTDYHITEKKITEKEISETDLDHIKSGPNELVIGNFWIFKGKITIQKQQNCSDNRRRRNWKLM